MDKDTNLRRKPYQKPKLERVDLVAEEQVLGGCKEAALATGLGHLGAGNCTINPQCMTIAGT